MITRALRSRRDLQAALAVTAVALLSTSSGVCAAPVEVTDYAGLVGIVGANDDYKTGERFNREVLVLVHKGDSCAPDFGELGLEGFGRYADMYALVSVDADHADKELLAKLNVDPAVLDDPATCPALSVIPRRAPVAAPGAHRPSKDSSRTGGFHLPVMRSQQVSVGVVNEVGFPLDIHYQWWDNPVKPTHIRTLAAGTENWMLSYKTTVLVALNKETQEEVGRHLVTGHGLFTVADRACTAETCGTSEGAETPKDNASVKARKQMDDGRLVNNRKQPEGLPQFTSVGFKKITVPDDVWDLIKTYYEENKDSPKKEKWGQNNVFTNNVEAPSYMVNLPENGKLKEQIFEGLRPILEEWSGVELVQTACYGVRVYTNTSWLANHVDTRATHAVSVIMQVDQDVEEDWPLMIYDHAGNDYNITMKPRDLVLYESATCVHGRPSSFHGKFYANAFVHYKPKDPEKWTKFIT